ncbi:TonB-dependent receptor [Maribellus luteus]|nr:TonB-dependent receptor [Maribellus luteus]
MKLTTLLLFLSMVTMATGSYSQNTRFSLNVKDATILQVLEEIERQTEFGFLFKTDQLDMEDRYTVNLKEAKIENVMNEVLDNEHYSYRVMDRIIVISKKDANPDDMMDQNNEKVSGKVSDSSGLPLPGVTVVVKGTTAGTVTDADGKYSLSNIPEGATLVFSFVGMQTQEVVVGSQTSIHVRMEDESIGLEEVVAIGYGVQRKVSITNAVSSIDAEELSERTSTNINQALQGRLSGVTIIDRGGAPGNENLTTRIRGITSLNDNTPLVLIDGVPGNLSQVNPVDIESVSVLKDAASAAIYGSRAAAGVILITTKAPTGGKLSVTYNGYFGIARTNNNAEHMDAVTYMKQQNAAYMNTYGYEFYTDDYIQQWPKNHAGNPEQYPLPNTWQEAMFDLAPQHSHTLTLSGGNEKITNRISYRYLDEKAILPTYKFNLSELRARTEFKLNKKLTISSNINIRLSERSAPIDEWSSFVRIWQGSQWGVPYYKDGSYGLSVDSFSPLIFSKEMGSRKYNKTYAIGIFSGVYQFSDALKFSAQYSTQHHFNNTMAFVNKYDFTDELHPERRTFNTLNRMTDNRGQSREDGIDFQMTYSNTFKKHTVSGIAGYSEIHYEDDYVQGYRQSFYNNELQTLSMGANDATQSATGGNSEWGLRSYFSRVNYEYDGKYLFEANARYDGSSRFAEGHRYGFFPSFSAGWRISSESFWKSLKEAVNELKLRGSWGEVGSQQVGLYSFMKTYNQRNYIFNDGVATGYRQTNLASEDISWETTTQLNIGLDAYFLNNKVNFSIDYYNKRTEDILLLVPIPSIIGLEPTNQNAGVVENKGLEFVLGGRQSVGDYKFELNFNLNYNQNKVIDLAGTGPHISAHGNSDYRIITTEGKPINSYYGFETDGFFQTPEEVANYAQWDGSVGPGDIKYVDQNNDGELTPKDYVIFGNEMPDWTFSSTMSVSWKKLKLDLFWQGVAGSDKLMTGSVLEHGIWGGFTHKIWEDYWTPENRDAKFPRPTKYTMKNAQISDFSMINGSYLRLKNIRLSYDIPQKFCNKLNISGINVYLSATNLLTFAELNKYHIDPEMEGRDQEYIYPQTSVTTIGLNVNF